MHLLLEPLFTLEKKLYASEEYLEIHGEPKSVEDLKNHHLIAVSSKAENYPFIDVNWILKLGMPKGTLHEPTYFSNSVECMIKAATNNLGIIGSYNEMSILRDSKLKNILPNIKDDKVQLFLVYPDYLGSYQDIIGIKKYLQNSLLELGKTFKN